MENNKNKKSVKFQGDMLNFYDFIQVFVFTRNHHLKVGLNLCYNNTSISKSPTVFRSKFPFLFHCLMPYLKNYLT